MTLVWESGITLQHPDNNDPLLDLNTQPSLDLQFATSKTLDDAVSGTNLIIFSRASSGTYVGSDGLIKSATTDAPRFGHDPVTGESLGLLIEEARTNYATQSANPSAWNTTHAATKETFAAVTAPDGSTITQGFRIPSGGSRIYPTLSSPGTVEPVASIYARAVSGTATLSLFIQGTGVQFNVSVPSDSWVRLNGTKASGVVTAFSIRGNVSQSEDVYLWGAQLEAGGSFPTSYILTSGSTVTRAADLATIEGTNFSSWHIQDLGTVFSNVKTYWETLSGVNGSIVQFDNGVNETGRIFHYKSGNNGRHSFQAAGTDVTPSIDLGLSYKAASTYDSSSYLTCANETLSSTGVPTVLSETMVRARIGSNGGNYLNGHISRLTYYPYRLTDTTLQEITS